MPLVRINNSKKQLLKNIEFTFTNTDNRNEITKYILKCITTVLEQFYLEHEFNNNSLII